MDGSLAEAQPAFLVSTPVRSVKSRSERIGIVGLGYVGLPISVALADVFETVIGYDTNADRVSSLQGAHDWTGEVDDKDLLMSSLKVTSSAADLAGCTLYIVAVPTPVDSENRPDFEPLLQSCRLIGPHLNVGDVVVFESTVNPGATEEICAPELEAYSTLKCGVDFHVGYSPERITPGDRAHQLEDVVKVVSAQTRAVLERVAKVYERIVPAGVHRAPSIKVAEAAKVFENTQRDVNIALMNEFSMICEKIGIETRDVVKATGTKWNALPFTPGLVGGHCIGVDPYYLTAKAQSTGIYPEIMLASRRRNDAMASEIATRAVKLLGDQDIPVSTARIGVLGVTFKENVPDMRNSKVVDLVRNLEVYGAKPLIADPHADVRDVVRSGIALSPSGDLVDLDLLIVAVPHAQYVGIEGHFLQKRVRHGGVLMDLRGVLERSMLRPDITYWSL